MRRLPLLALALVCLCGLAGCSAFHIGAQDATDPAAADDSLAGNASVTDPQSDVLGWEGGFWANETLNVTPEDGLNQSELDAVVARGMARVETVRGVEFARPVEVSLLSRSEYRDSLGSGSASGAGGSGDAGAAAAAAEQAARYEALFLVGESTDAGKQQSENDAATVQGFYDTREDRIVVVSESATPRMDEITLSQELYHAHQFRHALRETPFPRNATEDQVTGLISLVEGDANFVDARYQQRCESGWSCLGDDGPTEGDEDGDSDAGAGADDDTAPDTDEPGSNVHMGLYLLSYFPYAEGEELVRDIHDDEGWDGVDDLYGDPPLSSAAVIHQDRSRQTTEVTLADRSGGSWERVAAGEPGTTVGEAGIATMFAYTLYDDRDGTLVAREDFLNTDDSGAVNATTPLNYDLAPSAGWTGDKLYAYRNGDQTGYVWQTAWQSPAEATEFAEAYRQLLAYQGATQTGENAYVVDDGPFSDSFGITVDGQRVTVVNGPGSADLSNLYPRISTESTNSTVATTATASANQ
ncbi:Hvo_1808 family surface protein [Haloarchaeobius sp. DFWS5]|uniref:Hvo_1808 family surface protein n=1 Tax=Haloarchaeobius sp. DFWS5 TaxID=3446114 RepID=UPI003EBF36C2